MRSSLVNHTKSGTVNKLPRKASKINIKSVIETCEAMGFDPIERIIHAIENGHLDPDTEVKTCIALLPYIDSKKQEINQTIEGEVEHHIAKTSEELDSRVSELIRLGEARAVEASSQD